MFDRTVLAFGGPTHEHHHTHVEMVDPSIEKGARFLDEVQREAEKRVTDAVLLGVPSIDAKLVSYRMDRDFRTGTDLHIVAFKINGRVFKETFAKDEYSEEAVMDFLLRSLSLTLLEQMAPTLTGARQSLRFSTPTNKKA